MQFQKLRISGFKSFVDPVEIPILTGLTGIVGPNGCGKSNLLEALRWIMGASSAKAMRAGGMDDVIFSGSQVRAGRNHAEVLLQIDNREGRAPAPFHQEPILNVTRRIDRGKGSSYKINGTEVRARDVQLLFADASTGANSPSLVRQGQIAELIAAKASNRRKILEEAAGIAGLYGRRQETELKLQATRANLDRLDDLMQELQSGLDRLRREARHAKDYRQISEQIRHLEAQKQLLHWETLTSDLQQTEAERGRLEADMANLGLENATTETTISKLTEDLKPLKEESQIAAAILQRLVIEKDRIDRAGLEVEAEITRQKAALVRCETDMAHETQTLEDAKTAKARYLEEELALKETVAALPLNILELEAALDGILAERKRAEAEVENYAGLFGALEAEKKLRQAAVVTAENSLKQVQTQCEEIGLRKQRLSALLHQAQSEKTNLSHQDQAQYLDLQSQEETLIQRLDQEKKQHLAAETDWNETQAEEARKRDELRQDEDQLSQLQAEFRALKSLLAQEIASDLPPILTKTHPEPGYELALAAALGEDLEAPIYLKPSAEEPYKAPLSYWRDKDITPGEPHRAFSEAQWPEPEWPEPEWPDGVLPLSSFIAAPPELLPRLQWTGLVARQDGNRLQPLLHRGMRIVSREGDCWRWDGFITRLNQDGAGKSGRTGQILIQVNRLGLLEKDISELLPRLEDKQRAYQKSLLEQQQVSDTLKILRQKILETETLVSGLRSEKQRLSEAMAKTAAKQEALDTLINRFHQDIEMISQEEQGAQARIASYDLALSEAKKKLDAPGEDTLEAALKSAKSLAQEWHQKEVLQQALINQNQQKLQGLNSRREGLTRDLADWETRLTKAKARLDFLAEQAKSHKAALDFARTGPELLLTRRQELEVAMAEGYDRQNRALEALTTTENLLSAAHKTLKDIQSRLSETREQRAVVLTQSQTLTAQLTSIINDIAKTYQTHPENLKRDLKTKAAAMPHDLEGVERLLIGLIQRRQALGAVNLMAEEALDQQSKRLSHLDHERADLLTASNRLKGAIGDLNKEGRQRLIAAFHVINAHFQSLFQILFRGGQAELSLIESDDVLEAGLEIAACPPGKRLTTLSLMSGGEQALTALALIFAVFLANPAPICVLDEVDAPLDDANVERFCALLKDMRERTPTRFLTITHHPVTMSHMDRLFGVSMSEPGISRVIGLELPKTSETESVAT